MSAVTTYSTNYHGLFTCHREVSAATTSLGVEGGKTYSNSGWVCVTRGTSRHLSVPRPHGLEVVTAVFVLDSGGAHMQRVFNSPSLFTRRLSMSYNHVHTHNLQHGPFFEDNSDVRSSLRLIVLYVRGCFAQ